MAESQVTSPSDDNLDFDDDSLKAIAKVYSDRAAAHFCLGNYQQTLNDATAAVTLEPTFIKAIERGACACVKLKRYKEATTWCDKGLAIDKNNKTLLDLWTKSLSEPATSQEAKRGNMSLPVTHTGTGQSNNRLSVMGESQVASPSDATLDFDEGTLKAIAKVYSDRAAAHFCLGNYQETLNDATAAVTLEPTFIKAIERGASACIKLKRYKEATTWCDKGLEIAENKTLVDLRTKCLCKPNTSQETKRKNTKRLSATHTAVGQKKADSSPKPAKNEVGDTWEEGYASHRQEYFKRAIDHHERALQISKEIGDQAGERRVYCNLGCANQSLEDSTTTIINFLEGWLKIVKEVGDKSGERIAYDSLGGVYQRLGDFKTAIDYHERQLKIAKEMGDKAGEQKAYGNLGIAHQSLGDSKTAISYHERHLKMAKEVGDKAGEGNAYGGLGNAYQSLGDFETAIKYHERHLKIVQEVGDKAGEGGAYGNLGNDYQRLGDFKTASDYYERQLKVAKEMGDKVGEGNAYGNLGNAFQSLGDFKTAIECLKRYLKVAKEVGDKVAEGLAYGSLGNAYQSLGDFKTTIEYGERHLKIVQEVGDKAGEGSAYGVLGNAYQSLGDFKTTIEYGERHLKIVQEVGDKAGEGSAYGVLGNAYQRLGDFKTATDYHERGLKVAKEVGDKVGEGRAYGNLGIAFQSLGDFKTAIKFHERHLKVAKEMGNKVGEGNAYGNLGNAFQRLGDFKTAIKYHERHLKIVQEVGDKAGEGGAYGSLGNSYQSLGDYKTAFDYRERHLKVAKKVGDKYEEGSAYGRLGITYQSLGDFKTAIEYHERHLKVAQEKGSKVGEGEAYNALGNAYQSLGNFKKAIEYHERHLRIVQEIGEKVGEGMAYSNLGNAYRNLGDFKTALHCYERHLKVAKEVGDKDGEGKAYGCLGNAYQGLWNSKKAIDCYECSLKIAKEVGDKGGAALSFYNLGRSFEFQGFLPKAVDYFYSSVEMFNIVRHDLKGKDEWKISYRDEQENAYTCLWRALLKQGKLAEALIAAEQGRAQALNDLMELNYGLETIHCQLLTREESTYESLCFPPSTVVFMAIDELDIAFWVVQDGKRVELRKKKVGDDGSLNLKDFMRSLIMTASEEIGLRVGVKCEDRSLDKLKDEQVDSERSPQTPAKPVPFQMNVLRKFYDIIIEPIIDLVDCNELILVPDGPLGLAPYAAFVDSNSRFVCDAYRIRVIPSITSLKLITDSPAGYHSKTGVLLVGDPWVQEVVIPGKKLEQLPYARKEVQMIGRIFNTKPLIGREATKDEVLRRLSPVAVIHIAAHGRMETGEIALAPNATRASQIPEKEDFLLTMKDVMSAQIRARLVVLSCCHSGRGEIKAEGVVGIARAFLGAGARAVLVSLWAIDDEATLEFMKSFYSHVAKGISASESLNKAMKHLRESDEFNEVKHWAPFVLIGDDVTLECSGNE